MLILPDSISTAFDSVTTATERLLSHRFYVAWKRIVDDFSYGVVGVSKVNNCLVRGENTVLTPTESFRFDDETEKVVSLEYDRFIEEPLGGISYTMLDVELDNTDKRFTPEFNSTIGTAILPNRPVRAALGFNLLGRDNNLVVFKGLTDTIKEDKNLGLVRFSGIDYIYYLNDLVMNSAIYTDKRSDEIIEAILIEAGLGSSQYELDIGLNTIGFAWFNKDMTAGERIRRICEAEEANFYQDENGVIKFENRRKFTQSPYNSVVWTIHNNDILEWQQDESVEVVNRCVVQAEPRAAGDTTEIWKDGIVEEIDKGETKEIWASFENPCISIENPVATTDYIANTASDGTGSFVTGSVSVTAESFTDRVKLTIVNNSGTRCWLTYFRLRGTPAIIKSPIQQVYEDSDSIAKYDKHVLEISNDFIDNDSFAYYLARTIVQKYKDPRRRIRIRVRGIPRLQLKDKVNVYDRDLESYKSYRVMRIRGSLALGGFEQILTLRETFDNEADSWAIVGVTRVGSTNEFVGI